MWDWCSEQGITIEFSTTEQHQQNGKAEALNKTIQTRARATLIDSKLDRKYWPEIVKAISYLRNRSPSLTGKTPFEEWYGRLPNLSNIRTVGAKAWLLKPSHQRPKLVTDRADEGRLVGFEGQSIYRLLMKNGTIKRGSNVHFDEDEGQILGKRLRDTDLEVPPLEVKRLKDTGLKHTRSLEEGFALQQPDTVGELPDPIRFLTEPIEVDTRPRTAERQTEQNRVVQSPLSRPLSPWQDLPDPSQSGDQTNQNITQGGSSNNTDSEVEIPLRKSTRTRFPNRRILFGLVANGHIEPANYKQAQGDPDWPKWLKAMKDEHDSLIENETWKLVELPRDRKALQGRWVFKLKTGPKGEVIRHKARWVVKGYNQQEGIDYDETFAAVVKPMTYKTLFAIAAAHDYEIEQMDVKTAFLYGTIDKEIYMTTTGRPRRRNC